MKKYLGLIFILLIHCSSCQKEEKATDGKLNNVEGPLFEWLSPEQTGVTFENRIEDSPSINVLTYEYFYNGGGVAVGDINGDDLPDLYFTGNQSFNKLYLNKGNFEFEDITEQAGVKGSPGWSTGVAMADVNADGLLDIYVCKSGRLKPEYRLNELYINNGDMTFTEKAREYGLADAAYSTQALFFDYDRDNDLDMYLLNHSIDLFTGQSARKLKASVDQNAGDKLYRNDGGRFIDVSAQAGLNQNPLGYGLGVAAGDLNQDGWPDLYVTNDYVETDYMYLNNGDGTFREMIKEATFHTSNFSMGVDIADINNDAWPDIYVADMVAEDNYRQKTNMRSMNPEKFYKAVNNGFHYQYMFNSLQLNNQNMTFSDMAQMAGVSNTDWSWATLLEDFNNDGYKDLMVTNGFRKEFSNKDFVKYREKITEMVAYEGPQMKMMAMKELIEKLPETKIANYIFENNGDLTFTDRSADWGFDSLSYSNGAAVADLDNDGNLDIVINNIDAPAYIFRNKNSNGKNLKIRLNGPDGNPSGIGARIIATVGAQKIYKEHYLTRGYQSSLEDRIFMGVGNVETIDELTIIWPDGKMETRASVPAGEALTINYADADQRASFNNESSQTVFRDITDEAGLDYRHVENNFYDFGKEILLPHKMSQFGPAMAVGDVNGDGLEDVFLGAAIGAAGKLYLQNGSGAFTEAQKQFWEKDSQMEDVGAVFFDADQDGDLDLYVASGGNEYLEGSEFLEDRLYLNRGNGKFRKTTRRLPGLRSSGAAVKPFDFDVDGDLDLFVGGRVLPQKYPSPANSYILENDKGYFTDVTEKVASEFLPLGMVTDAVWADVNANKKIDLAIVGEWMPVRVFEYDGGKFKEITDALGLADQTGWWYSISASDLDGDGDLELIAGNLGKNYKYKASDSEPFQVYYNDFDENGTGDIVLGYFNEGTLFPLRGRQCSSDQMPFIKEKFETYHEFGQASLREIYGEKALKEAINYKARTFASTIFDNKDNIDFEPLELPNRAQLSSINGIIPADFDGDGIKDLLVAGNLYPVEVETTRNDASVGVFLKGIGNLEYQPMSPVKSGFFAPGDIKKISLINLADEQVGILMARNDGPVQLLRVE